MHGPAIGYIRNREIRVSSWSHSQGLDDAQNTYVVRMWVSDVKNGEVVWEKRSDPIAKKFEKGSVSW